MSLRTILAAAAAALLAHAAPLAAQAGTSYTLLIYETPAQLGLREDPAAGAAYWRAYAEIGDSLRAAGVLRGGAALRTSGGVATVRVEGGRVRSEPAAYARTEAPLGGYFVIEVASLEEAVRWAARIPAAAGGAVEVRPAYPVPAMMGMR